MGRPPTYTFNKNYFDRIDSEEKAYWLGFIWCDGYVIKRQRNTTVVYEFKLSLADQDGEHLHKLNKSLESNYPIKRYNNSTSSFSSENSYENRLYIANNYFASILYEQYGLIPHRHDITKLVTNVPRQLHKHLIRGILEADGSFTKYYCNEPRLTNPAYKINLAFTTYENLLHFIQNHFFENKIIHNISTIGRRHEDGDQYCRELKYSGTVQVPRILNYLYDDATIFLDRKFQRYADIKNKTNKKVV